VNPRLTGGVIVKNDEPRKFNFFEQIWSLVTNPQFVRTLDAAAIGRLVALKEAAGKLRTVAIVDPLTQWVLRPVHLWLFRILSSIAEDGTFDQIKAFLSFSHLGRFKFIDPSCSSLDLSAATDRLPLELQVRLLSYPFGKEFALN